jgi:hypothetical protein
MTPAQLRALQVNASLIAIPTRFAANATLGSIHHHEGIDPIQATSPDLNYGTGNGGYYAIQATQTQGTEPYLVAVWGDQAGTVAPQTKQEAEASRIDFGYFGYSAAKANWIYLGSESRAGKWSTKNGKEGCYDFFVAHTISNCPYSKLVIRARAYTLDRSSGTQKRKLRKISLRIDNLEW